MPTETAETSVTVEFSLVTVCLCTK